MHNRFYKILEKVFNILFYIILAGLFLKGEIFRINTGWFSLTFTSVKNFVLLFIVWWIALRVRTRPKISLWFLSIIIAVVLSILFSKYPITGIRACYVLLISVFWFYSILFVLKEDKKIPPFGRHFFAARKGIFSSLGQAFAVLDCKKLLNTAVIFVALASLINIINLLFHLHFGLSNILERYPFWEGKNALGLFLVMTLCVSGSLPGRVWGPNSLLLIIGVVFSYSRGAWFSGILAILGLILYRFKRFVFIIIGCIAIFFIISPAAVTTRFIDDTNIKERLTLWNNAIEIIKRGPIIGSGFGTFTEVYRDSYPNSIPLTGSGSRIIRHAHSLYLQVLVETGSLGLVVFSLLVVRGFIFGVRNFIKEEDKFVKSIRYGSLLGILAFFVYSITDCTTSWRFVGDSFSHINLIWILFWSIVLQPCHNEN